MDQFVRQGIQLINFNLENSLIRFLTLLFFYVFFHDIYFLDKNFKFAFDSN